MEDWSQISCYEERVKDMPHRVLKPHGCRTQ